MAFTATITKSSVTRSGSLYNVSLKVVINDGAEDVLDFNISARYNSSAPDMSSLMATLQDQIKDRWDEYASNKVVFDATVLTTGVATLQSQANTYINA
jgi:hypothetical protein